MASVDRTAYPRFKRNISVRELHEAYSPSLDEMDWARGLTGTDDHLLSLLVWLKSCQRLGYFPRPGEIPGVVGDREKPWEVRQRRLVADLGRRVRGTSGRSRRRDPR